MDGTTAPPAPPAWARGDKKLAREWCRRIAQDAPDGTVTGADGTFLAALLHRHPRAAEKIGPGIAFISLGKVPGYRSRGFIVHRTDGTSTDFSWRDCISPAPGTAQVRKAMRHAVDDQVLAFKREQADAGGLYSAITGKSLAWEEAEVDHHPVTFATLADTYADAAGGYDKIPLAASRDGQIGRRLESWHESTWMWYHQQNARLRIVSGPENRP